MLSPLSLVQFFLTVLIWTIILSIVISWLRIMRVNLPHHNPVLRLIEDTGELLMRPIRRSFPTTGGGLDFAPMIVLIILYILKAIVRRLEMG
jgi:YggT family protein